MKSLYLMRCLDIDNFYKVGVSSNIEARRRSMKHQTGYIWEVIIEEKNKGNFYEGFICTVLRPYTSQITSINAREFFECEEAVIINAFEMIRGASMMKLFKYKTMLNYKDGRYITPAVVSEFKLRR